MIDTDKYENMRRLFLDFIDTADEDTEDAWKNKLTMLDELLAEVKRLREVNDLLGEAVKEDNEILKKYIETLAEVKRLREALRIERRIVQAFYDYRDARCYEDCEAWMLENGHRVMVKYGNEEQSEWKVEVQ